ncbi:MAG: sulfite exporter TauE/SafE family protein [Eubacteriales bacterium]
MLFSIHIGWLVCARRSILRYMEKKSFWIKIAGLGLFAGVVNGFLGSAGGILIVPGFIFMGMEEKRAHATSLLVIAPISLISVFVYGSGGYVRWDDAVPLLAGAVIGGVAGACFLDKINKKVLEWVFTGIIIFSGIRMIW